MKIENLPSPCRILSNTGKSVFIEWQFDGKYLEAEIENGRIEWMFHDGEKFNHFETDLSILSN